MEDKGIHRVCLCRRISTGSPPAAIKAVFPSWYWGAARGPSRGRAHPAFRRTGEGRKLSCWLLFLSCSQFKIILVPQRHVWGRPTLIPFHVCLKTRARPGRREPESSSLEALLPSGQGLLQSLSLAHPLATASALWLAGRGKDKEQYLLLRTVTRCRVLRIHHLSSVEPRGVMHWIPLTKWEVSHISTLWLLFSGSNKIRFHTLFFPNHLCQRLNRNTPWYSNKVTSGMKNGKPYAIKLQNQSKIGRRTPKEP